jgi:hypothetical protein
MMLGHKLPMSRKAAILLIAAASLGLGGCSSMKSLNPFGEKAKAVPGERRAVFQPGSGFEGPRKLPPPGSDYMGATMPAGQPVTQSPATPTTPPAPGTHSVAAPPAPPTAQ